LEIIVGNGLFTLLLGYPLWAWLLFMALVVALLAFDLGVLHKEQHAIGVRESLKLSLLYIGVALAFGAWVWWYKGVDSGMQFLTGYLIEKSLSLDNIFVVSLIFGSLAIPRRYQHRVLFWGILGVLLLRGVMIGVGAALVAQFQWVLVLFGMFLIAMGGKMLLAHQEPTQLADHVLYRWLQRHLRVTSELYQAHFWVRGEKHGLAPGWWATPLLLALLLVESADAVFALDSIPAIFAISQDPFIVFTSNIFAVLGLRALYFALAAMVHRFDYLQHALALVLAFIGTKVCLGYLHEQGWIAFHIPTPLALLVTAGLLVSGVLVSLYRSRGETSRPASLP
jgi:tellurite resistance protein TerC